MTHTETDGGVLVTGLDSFSLTETLECGQCFCEKKAGEKKYHIVACGKILTAEQRGDSLFFSASAEEFEKLWIPYFDLSRDYKAIKETLAANDFVMRDAIEYAPGLRVLKQEFFECLISYIISQNNRIPMIHKVIKNISDAFGEPLGEIDGEKFYSFPPLEVLRHAKESELRVLKTGFRDKYIVDACQKLWSGEIEPESFDSMETAKVREILMSIKGVGQKVADCVLLFSLGRHEVFPTDVWVKRVMQHFYFDGQAVGIKEIHKLSQERFGAYAGFAQEYLFYYARQFQIGKQAKGD